MWYNRFMIWALYSPLHNILDKNTMVINVVGRKSGTQYRLPVSYQREGESLVTVSYKQRTWWRNLRGGMPIKLHFQGKDVTANCEVIEDELGVIEGLIIYIGRNPQMARILAVNVDKAGKLEPESLRQAAQTRVIIKTEVC